MGKLFEKKYCNARYVVIIYLCIVLYIGVKFMNTLLAAIDLSNFRLGTLEGFVGIFVLVFVGLAALALIVAILVNAVKSFKEKADRKDDDAEDKFYEQYGVTGEEVYLNQRLAQMRGELASHKKSDAPLPQMGQPEEQPVEEPAPVVEEPVKEEPAPVVEEPVKEEPTPAPQPEPEPTPAPVVEEPVKEEPKPAPVEEPAPVVEEPAPVEEPVKEEPKVEEPAPVVEEPKKEGVAKPPTKKVVKKKPDDWSKYEGDYEGYYYDPEDACYYEGEPSPALAKKLAAKRAELEAAAAKDNKKVIIKKVAPPFAALKTPKNIRNIPAKVDGFDEAIIYGKYVIEHCPYEGKEEYFYTLYDPAGKMLYESNNYSSLEYCKRAINRLKSHAIIGQFTIEAEGGKFFFVLKRKSYEHRGEPQVTFDQANDNMRQFKNYVQTDIIREQ